MWSRNRHGHWVKASGWRADYRRDPSSVWILGLSLVGAVTLLVLPIVLELL